MSANRPPRSLEELLSSLSSSGYTFKIGVDLVGYSGSTHSVDMLAQNSESGRKIIFLIPDETKALEYDIIRAMAIGIDLRAEGYVIVPVDSPKTASLQTSQNLIITRAQGKVDRSLLRDLLKRSGAST